MARFGRPSQNLAPRHARWLDEHQGGGLAADSPRAPGHTICTPGARVVLVRLWHWWCWRYGTRCCSGCQGCSCCGWPNAGCLGCCSRNRRAARDAFWPLGLSTFSDAGLSAFRARGPSPACRWPRMGQTSHRQRGYGAVAPSGRGWQVPQRQAAWAVLRAEHVVPRKPHIAARGR